MSDDKDGEKKKKKKYPEGMEKDNSTILIVEESVSEQNSK